MLPTFVPLLFLSLVAPAIGASPFSTSVCLTKYGSKSVNPVPRSTQTRASTFTVYRFTTYIPTKTVTPKAVTSTTTVDVTSTDTVTAPQETDTFYTTTTIETTETSTSTTTQTIEVVTATTVTTGDGTSTVTTNAGFTPIQSVPGNPASRKKRAEGHARRASAPKTTPIASLEERGSQKSLCGLKDGKPYIPNRYPTSVSCQVNLKAVTTKTITATFKRTITRTASKPTSWSTLISTHVTTTTINPVHASTTLTETTTTTLSTSTTTTETTSSTLTNTETVSAAPTATSYPGCSASNFISSRAGHGIQGVIDSGSNAASVTTVSTASALECCQQCFLTSNCGGSAWYGGMCYLLIANTCKPDTVLFEYLATDDFDAAGYTVSDGNCGRLQWDGTA